MEKIKDKLVFLDTETTGIGQDDRLFQIAYKNKEKTVTELFNPGKRISFEASEVTGYTDEDVEDKIFFKDSLIKKELEKLFLKEGKIFVAHNAEFDIEMLRREGVIIEKFIDTLKVARFLDNNSVLDSYRLQYLRYALSLKVDDARAHDALGDILVLESLFERLFNKMMIDIKKPDLVLDKMIEISSKPSLIRKINFGKYKGKKMEEIVKIDRSYLEWLLEQKEKDEDGPLKKDWLYTLKFYLNLKK